MTQRLIEIDSIPFFVSYDYTKGTPDRLYMPNGDPGYPGDPAEVYLNSVLLEDWELLEYLDKHTLERIEEIILLIESEAQYD